jgi:hypothetical protein
MTYFVKYLLAPFSPCFPIFTQSLKGIWIKLREIVTISKDKIYTKYGNASVHILNVFTLMMGWDIVSGSKITDFEHIFKEPLIFLGNEVEEINENNNSHKKNHATF